MPWRQSRDPYAIWVSEIMLQQTQVATVLPYFEKWMTRFPTVESLAESNEDEVLSQWQGLGYYRRCRMLIEGARYVQNQGFPTTANEWRQVPGVGPYTAGAIASIALGQPAALVDGNVERVYARLTSDSAIPPTLTKNAWRWAEEQVNTARPGDWNQALMELGATVCLPRNPQCPKCPISGHCKAHQQGRETQLPTPKPKPEIKSLAETALVYAKENRFALLQISPGKWWQGMWAFPPNPLQLGKEIGTIKATVTNHRITYAVSLETTKNPPEDLKLFTKEELDDLPLPSPQRKVLAMAKSALGR